MSAKNRLIRNIIISVVALAVLGGAYIFVSKWEPSKDEPADDTPVELLYAVNEEEKDVTHIQVKNEDGEYTLSRAENEGTATYDVAPLDADDKNMAAISSSFKAFLKVYATREISSDKAEDFGFEESRVSVTLNKINGEKVSLVFGDEVPGGGEYYCINKKDNKIYTVSATIYQTAVQNIEYFRVKSVIAISDVLTISKLEIFKDGKMLLKLRYATDEENATKIMPDSWTMVYPWNNAELAEDKTTELLTSLSTIYGKGFSDESHSYKYKMNITSGDKTYSLEIAEGKDETYVRNSDSGIVYIADKEIYDIFEAVEPKLYISRFVNLINIEKLSKLTVWSKGKEYIMEVGQEDGKGYKINGADTDEKEFKKKYQEIIGLSFIEYVDDKPSGEIQMTIEFDMKNGEKLKTEIYDYSEREYLAVRPDGTVVKVLKSVTDKIESMM